MKSKTKLHIPIHFINRFISRAWFILPLMCVLSLWAVSATAQNDPDPPIAHDLNASTQQDITPDENNIVYVNQEVDTEAEGYNASGDSWDNALPELRDALAWAQDWDGDADGTLQIWVAEGLYLPTNNATDREATFRLVNGVEVYGGFPNTGDPVMADRNWTDNETILSGDINGSGDLVGNSYSVVTGSGTDNTAVIDGFTITAGNADVEDGHSTNPDRSGGGMYNSDGSPTVTNSTFSGNEANRRGGGMYNISNSSPVVTNSTFSGNSAENNGGGMYNISDSSPVVTNSTFSGNSAGNIGGGMYVLNCNPTLANVIFSGNSAGNWGGGMYATFSGPMLTNVAFSGNSAGSRGGGMFIDEGDLGLVNPVVILNTVFWNNQDGSGIGTASASIDNPLSTSEINYSLVQGCNPDGNWTSNCGTDGGNNLLDADPLFVETPDPGEAPTQAGNLRLTEFSPAINAGTNTPFEAGGAAEGITTDLDGNDRIFGDIVDMGAYEFQGEPGVVPGGEDRRVLVSNAAASYTVTQMDFSVNETVSAVKIETIAGGGTLLLDEEPVSEGDEVTSQELEDGDLTWTPVSGEHGYSYASFVFRLINQSDVESTDVATLYIDLAAASVALTEGKGWRFLTSPSQGETFEGFLSPVTVQGVPGSGNPGARDPNLYVLDQEDYQWELPDAMSSPIDPGKGFIVFGFEDDLPATLTSGENWLPLDGQYEYGGLFYDPDQGEQGDSHFLLANPHPVSLDFCEFTRNLVADNVQIWDPAFNDGDYRTLNCVSGGAEIAPFQAFWVRTMEGSPALGIPEEAYLAGPAGGYFKERSAMSHKDIADLGQGNGLNLLTLSIESEDGEGFTNDVQILFSEEGTTGMDEWDAPKLSAKGLAPRWLSFYALDENQKSYALRSLPLDFGDQITIPLGIETTQAGSYTLSWTLPGRDHFSGSYYLRDTQTGTLTELSEGQSYRFEIEESMAAHSKWADDSGQVPGPVHSSVHGEWTDEAPRFELIVTTDELKDSGTELPAEIVLRQNYPNPFNPATIISYELPQQAHVRLDVYDMTGRHVAELVNEQASAGRHQVSFNAMNLSSGVYMYRLQAGGTVLSRQLTLIK
jgi:hypothetical protein